MIAVIADDITGAAEIGGIALCHGLSSEVQTVFSAGADVDVIIVDTDSRSCDASSAVEKVSAAARDLLTVRPEWLYKKVDSALRGHILAEISAVLACSRLEKCLLAPANPAIGRTIVDGHYRIGGVPLHETDFGQDPEHPASTSDVVRLLTGGTGADAAVARPGAPLPPTAIAIAESRSTDDLFWWAGNVSPKVLPAGGGAFFIAILSLQGYKKKEPAPCRAEGNTLFVCGSSTTASRQHLQEARRCGVSVHQMPLPLFSGQMDSSSAAEWADSVIRSLIRQSTAIAAIDRPAVVDSALALHLRECTARLVRDVLESCPVSNVYIEGGATAAAVISCLGWKRFRPVAQPAHGVVTMQVLQKPELLLTLKPGSFQWPAGIWNCQRR
jgi:uncharacterized protein YgbK (DUF1537 family)